MTTPEHTLVHLVRHGEVDNPGGVLYGRLAGFPLTERGRAMAERVAEHTADWPLTHLASSPLERARETLAPIAARHPHLEPQVSEAVLEATNDFEGQVFGPGNQALRKPANWWKLRNPLRPSWGEPFTDLAERMRTGILEAARAAGPGGQALVVSHQLPIWIARLDAEGRRLVHDPRKRQCTLASITTFHLLGERVVRVSYAEPALGLIPSKDRNANFSSGHSGPLHPEPTQ
ncbi:histidine phosphatase family protein [Aestuariimicrobium ganziense]|uniref:histidine phosphatase family protein n=1 Tax=Aestuariimicrobium ganziense TaxID=2773677 RepID=UPI002E2914FB|nr:histidine phosphatase family protein [Aestuariimicrobium ganziense]